jgi:hypothetical protein
MARDEVKTFVFYPAGTCSTTFRVPEQLEVELSLSSFYQAIVFQESKRHALLLKDV